MRIVILDRDHAPDVGHPVYIEDRPDLRGKPVWAVAYAESDESGQDWDIEYEAEGLTYDQAEAY